MFICLNINMETACLLSFQDKFFDSNKFYPCISFMIFSMTSAFVSYFAFFLCLTIIKSNT